MSSQGLPQIAEVKCRKILKLNVCLEAPSKIKDKLLIIYLKLTVYLYLLKYFQLMYENNCIWRSQNLAETQKTPYL